ncbi:MAG: efflux RND transporter periplasmic adaptor subunit [Gammaproteobacteria bacterium]
MRIGLGVLLMSLCACGGEATPEDGATSPPGPPPATVSVAEVVTRTVTEWDQFNGRIEAVHSVDLRPRVGGYLAGVHFQEGSVVARDDILFTIDDREYRANVDRARANLQSATTRLELAELELARSQKLIAVQAMSTEEFEQRRSEQLQAKAQIASADADLIQANLNLEFATIRAPIDGRIGEAFVRPGNLIQPNATLLTTLVSIDPVYVVFEGDENIYLNYQARSRSGDRPSSRDAPNPVRVGLSNEVGYPHEGTMDFVDNQLNPATGTIRGRAILPNPNGVFTPGLFARVRLIGRGEYPAVLISDRAVLTDQDRKYVYVVGQNSEALRRDVTLGRDIDGLRVVQSGLEAGEQVVVNGVRKIFFPGAPLNPQLVTMEDPTATVDGVQ